MATHETQAIQSRVASTGRENGSDDAKLSAAEALRVGGKTQLFCAWSGTALIAIAGIAMFGGGLFPPIAPAASAKEVARFYGDHTTLLRLGLLVAFFAFGLWGCFVSAITTQMRRIPNVNPVLARTQQASGVLGWVFLSMPLLIYSAAAYRPNQDPHVLQGINDIAWFTFIMPVMPFISQAIAVGVAALQDKSREPIFPRWFGYLSLWEALVLVPGGLLTFFKVGPFDWRGIFAFWVPLGIFGVWLIAMSYVLDRAIRREMSAGAQLARC
jgi:hypothetical protein